MSDTHPEPAVVAVYATEFEASLTKNMLMQEGIPCELVGAMTAGFRAEAPGEVKVLVPANYEEQALRLLIEHAKGMLGNDDSDDDSDGDESTGDEPGKASDD